MSFKDSVLEVVRQIPKGSVLTYKQVATMAGNPKAARAVGTIMKSNQLSVAKVGYVKEMIPCHRVIRTDGKIGDYNGGGASVKKQILTKEGALPLAVSKKENK